MEKQFAKGIYAELPSEKAPSFIKMKLSFKVADAAAFLAEHENNAGYVNCDVKESKDGKIYVELNDFKPKKPESLEETGESSVPF